jgi:type IV secretory pathway VirB6-like protein
MKMIVNIMKALKLILTGKITSPVKPALLMLALVMLTACPAPDPSCVEADDWGDKTKVTVKVPANEEFTSAKGITVENGQKISVKISGDHIDICPDGPSFSYVPKKNFDKNGKLISTTNPIDPKVSTWQAASYSIPGQKEPEYIKVTEGSKISINIFNSYSDREGEQTQGKGLYVYIGDTAPPESNPMQIGAAGNWWYGNQYASSGVTADGNKDNRKAGKGAKYPEFFELWDNGSLGDGVSGFSGLAPKSGKLWFKYARTASARGLDNSGGDQFSPWLGRYADEGAVCGLCTPPGIMATCTPVLAVPLFGPALYAACVGATAGACAASGHIYQVDSGRNKDGRYCREILPKGDSWVDNAYDGTEWDNSDSSGKKINPNGINVAGEPDGYTITIQTGCDGTYGQFMDMNVGYGQPYLVDKTEPEGCIVGTDKPCDLVKGEWGETIKLPKYTVSTTSSPVSMDMRNAINGRPNGNPGYKSTGYYEDKLASTGELWFHIKDEVSTSSHPDKGFYGDNLGSYKVTVETKKVNTALSDLFNSLINPIRGIIFGYCRVPGENVDPALKYNITESGCGNYVDAKGESHPGWQPGITRMMYDKLVNVTVDGKGNISSNGFLSALRASLVLYVIIYGGMFMMGMVEDKQEDFLKRIIRFGMLATLLSAGSWNFFNNYLFSLFTEGIDSLIGAMTIQFSPTDSSVMIDPVTGDPIVTGSAAVGVSNNIFAFADMTASKFLNLDSLKKIMGLLFASPLGIVYVILILMGLVLFVFSLVKALLLYLLALLAISLLLILAPIFISFMLFERTRPLFDGWIKNLMNYTLQPVLVFAAISIFNVFIYTALAKLLHYGVCWETVWSLNIGAPGAPIEIPLVKFFLPQERSDLGGLPVQLFMIFIFIIICQAMYTFIDWMSEMAAHLTTENKGTALGKVAAKALTAAGGKGAEAFQAAKGIASKGVAKGAQMAKAKATKSANKVSRK